MSVFFLFIDGIGVGAGGVQNPLDEPHLDSFMKLTGGQGLTDSAIDIRTGQLLFTTVDANLDMAGLPQSGTGQVSLFSGVNAAEVIGRHFGPFPHSGTRHLLEQESLFQKVKKAGFKPHFINAYPDIFFEKMNRRKRWTSTTLMAVSSGQKLNGLHELQEGLAVTAGINQLAWREQLGLDVGIISAEQAADRIMAALDRYDMVMYEYYLTDKAGHSRNRKMSLEYLETLNRFIRQLLREMKESDYLVICSDHGNLENLSVKTHTRNRVPLMIRGAGAGITDPAESITDLPGIILKLLTGDGY